MENTETVTTESTETQATETAAPVKEKRTRGPRSELTAGDLQQAFRLSRGDIEFVKGAMEGHSVEVQQAALKNLAKVNAELATELGYAVVPKDEAEVDFRRGVFVHLAHLNAEKGDRVKLEQIDDGVIVRLVRQ